MKSLAPCTDPGSPKGTPTRLARWLTGYLQDSRDLPFVYLLGMLSGTVLPLAIALFVPALTGWGWWAVLGLFYYLSLLRFKGPFGLMLHCTTHRLLFKKKYGYLNHYIPWIIGPLFGQTPETYFVHHLGMHHPENNSPEDESSTMRYQRDSVRDFLRYFGDFFFLAAVRLWGYFTRRNKLTLRRRLLRGELMYGLVTVALCLVNWPAAVVVLVVPFILSRFIMMLGNWAQHAFIAPESPINCYTNSITCLNTRYNHQCWNDGYHTSHHLHPALHWTEHPAYFQQSVPQYVAQGAIVFDGIHFLHIFGYLMGKRYDLLAHHFVELRTSARSEAEVMALLRARTQRLPI